MRGVAGHPWPLRSCGSFRPNSPRLMMRRGFAAGFESAALERLDAGDVPAPAHELETLIGDDHLSRSSRR